MLLAKEYNSAIDHRAQRAFTKLLCLRFVHKFKKIMKKFGSNLDLIHMTRIHGFFKFNYYSFKDVTELKAKVILMKFCSRSIIFMKKLGAAMKSLTHI